MYKPESKTLTDEVRATAEGLFIDLPCCNTHYTVDGTGDRWAVCVHGYATPYFIYDKLSEGLVKAGYRVLRYDLIGRGLSERKKIKYDPDLFVRQLKELVDALGVKTFDLIGTSMGGIITTSFVAAYPNRVKKLVLLAPAGMHYKMPLVNRMMKVPVLGDAFFKAIGCKVSIDRCASELVKSGKEVRDDYKERFAYCMQFKGVSYALLSCLRYTLQQNDLTVKAYQKVAEIGLPVLTVWGTNDQTMPYFQSEEMKKILPQAELVTYVGSGHIFVYDEGERTVNTVLPFLQR